jgi:hypothetical protein
MRTTSRLALSAAVLGSSLLFAAPAAAQTAPTPCPYPFTDCPTTPPPSTPPGGGEGEETVSPTGTPVNGGGGGGGGGTAVDGRSELPFTGGEITLLALAGTAALGGGAALVVAGRRRQTA